LIKITLFLVFTLFSKWALRCLFAYRCRISIICYKRRVLLVATVYYTALIIHKIWIVFGAMAFDLNGLLSKRVCFVWEFSFVISIIIRVLVIIRCIHCFRRAIYWNLINIKIFNLTFIYISKDNSSLIKIQ
jgi:hypothetical protein